MLMSYLLFLQHSFLTVLITTHLLRFIQVVSHSSLLHIFTLYISFFSHVSHYYKILLFINVICLTFLITTHFLLFIQVVCITFLITVLLFSLYRMFVSRSSSLYFFTLYTSCFKIN